MWKVWINADVYRSTRKGKTEMFFVMSQYVCLTTRCYTTSHPHQVFFNFARIFSLFSLIFRTSNFWSLIKEFIKTIIPFALVGYETGYSQLPSLANYHLISNARSWNNITIEFMFAGINMFWARLRLILARAAMLLLLISLWRALTK